MLCGNLLSLAYIVLSSYKLWS